VSDDPELKRNNDHETRDFRREILVVAVIVGLFILVGAIWTALDGPKPIPGSISNDPASTPGGAPLSR
jgi:uncharacterized membrane protein